MKHRINSILTNIFQLSGGCIWVLFGCEKCDTAQYEIFPIAILLGAGGSAMLINCLAIVANLIATNIGKYQILNRINVDEFYFSSLAVISYSN